MASKKKKKYNKPAKVEKAPVSVVEIEEVIIAEENKNEGKIKYEVILATPTYYIINKNGTNALIKENNNYKKGDMISL